MTFIINMFIYKIYYSIRYILWLFLYIWNKFFFFIKENIMCQNSNIAGLVIEYNLNLIQKILK